MRVKDSEKQALKIQAAAQRLLNAIEDLRDLFPDGELPQYLHDVEHAIEPIEPILKEIVKARPY